MSILDQILQGLLALIRSEASWTALGAIGGVGALYLIYKQLAHTGNVTAYEFLRREDDRFSSQDMQADRSRLARVLLTSPNDYARVDEVADYVLGYFEDLGLMMRRKVANPYSVWTMNAYYVLLYWEATRDYVAWVRREREDPTYYNEFEYLYRCVAHLERKARKTGNLVFEPVEVRKFLREELHLQVSPFQVTDFDQVLAIEKASFDEVEAYDRPKFEELLREHPGCFLVARCTSEIAGYIIAYVDDKGGEIDSLAVAPGFRKLGIGRRLMETALREFEATGVEVCWLETRTTNQRAICFFEGLGFRTAETVADYYAEGADACRMQKVLKR